MTTPFGPQLIGETEKTLNALLGRFLAGTELTEPQWVTLRLADLLGGTGGAAGLTAAVADRGHFPDASALVTGLTDRGLLDNGRLTPAGRRLTAAVQDTITTETAADLGRPPRRRRDRRHEGAQRGRHPSPCRLGLTRLLPPREVFRHPLARSPWAAWSTIASIRRARV